ncbi:DUF2199 domain-containing protein [Saccharothrix variisporea]|uniref:DUF2199 domain-containing protein n=1 Tax=Saccharothrix variisporea TaxID=543527 RepID=A0A495XFC6_9PSEU|nr:DUF2199 domain-containing protein [Saccharothrix variisporea]RKT70258.1 hypothetical protein DFJ66_3514 [Saccharothrix variisporea]
MTASYLCSCCDRLHPGPPFGYGAPAPAFWHDGLADDPDSILAEEQCVIGGEHHFVRARLVLPVVDADEDFEWGVWVSLSPANAARAAQLWDDPARVAEPPYFGWLSTDLPGYDPGTLNLKTMVHTQEVGVRPLVELEPTDHPLAVEQRGGITVERVRAIAELLLHPPA